MTVTPRPASRQDRPAPVALQRMAALVLAALVGAMATLFAGVPSAWAKWRLSSAIRIGPYRYNGWAPS